MSSIEIIKVCVFTVQRIEFVVVVFDNTFQAAIQISVDNKITCQFLCDKNDSNNKRI